MSRLSICRVLILAGLVFALAALGGCGGNGSKNVVIKGQLALAGGQSGLPDDATARVNLIAKGNDSGGEQIVAERTLHGLGKPPIEFSMPVDQALLSQDMQYALDAQIVDSEGQVIWQTQTARNVDVFDQDHPAKLVLEHKRLSVDGVFKTYRCSDGFNFDLAHDKQSAMVHLGQRLISLHAAHSLSRGSVRYIDEHNDEIVIGSGVTSIYFDGISHHGCRVESSESGGNGTPPIKSNQPSNSSS